MATKERTIVNNGATAATDGSTLTASVALTSLAQGDGRVIEQLYDAYAGRAYSMALRMLGSPAVAEEAVQEAFLAVWKGRGSFDMGRGAEAAWVLTIVRNRALDRLRAESRHTVHGGSSLDEAHGFAGSDDTAAAAMVRLERADLRCALDTLPLEQRLAINLAYFEGLTHAEIAARLNVPLGTVKGRLRLGLRKLGVALDALGETAALPSEPLAPHR